MPPAYVKLYVKWGKNDAADAEAIAEVVTRLTMRFVAVKTEPQYAVLMLHKTRDLLVRQRTMLINPLRGHVSEFGTVSAQSFAALTPWAGTSRYAFPFERFKATRDVYRGQVGFQANA